ncbi:DUF3422 domain-containing protein [Granulosicoccaceae sp. 1_MG-2023]|nr:DUF3422 domain-containing protein [Granulosicoccaceae sp. 1_MG-2023]
MPLSSGDNHPQRFELANELHARPFPKMRAPCSCAYLAIKQPHDAAHRDPQEDRRHLLALLNHYGAAMPAEESNHYYASLGRVRLKWERHTEFVTYTIYADGVHEKPFTDDLFAHFPAEWIADAPGKVLTSCIIRVEPITTVQEAEQTLDEHIKGWFVEESLATSRVVDDNAIVCGDFRIDPAGHVRFAILACDGVSERRLGRIAQRLLEIETYKSMAMLTLPEARRIAARVGELDDELARLVSAMAENKGPESETLDRLLRMAAEIELLVARSAFRFSAAGAYEAIVNQRIEVLREERMTGRQLFSEFMHRRFDPAMRTCRSAQQRLTDLSGRAARASNLLRTRVDVANASQNHQVLASMNQRSELQLRLQETVEGLSVVAISYYAVNLLTYLLTPLAALLALDKKWLTAGLIIPVVLAVMGMIRRIKKGLNH